MKPLLPSRAKPYAFAATQAFVTTGVSTCIASGAALGHWLAAWALAYKQVLGLFLSQRRPSFYLIEDRGALDELVRTYLPLLVKAGVLTSAERDAVQQALRGSREQYFIRVTANVPFERFWSDPAFAEVLRGLQGLGLAALPANQGGTSP